MDTSIFNSLNISKFDGFCYELFSLEKIVNAIYKVYLDELNIPDNISYRDSEKVEDANDLSSSEDKNDIIDLNDPKLKFYDQMKNIWSTLENSIKNYPLDSEDNNYHNNPKISYEIQYAIISLADEVFLKKDKIISDYWKNNLLEYHFFGTRSSGSIVFDKIKNILENNDKQLVDIAFVYFIILNLGFKGKYSTSNIDDVIKLYKKQLYTFIAQIIGLNNQEDRMKFSNTLNIPWKIKENFLPNVKKWYVYIAIVFIIYIILSSIIWFVMTYGLSKKIEEINQNIYEINK